MRHYHVKIGGVSWCQYRPDNMLDLLHKAQAKGIALMCSYDNDLRAADSAMFLREHGINAYVVEGRCDQQASYVEDADW